MWISKKAGQKNRQVGYRRVDPSVRRRKKIRKRILWTVASLFLYIVTIAYIDRIVFLFEPEISTTSESLAQLDDFNPSPLILNAFKLGHGLTQLRYAETDDHQYIKWRNRTIAHLVALGINTSIIHEAIADCILTLDETIVLRDQIRVVVQFNCKGFSC